MLSSTALLIQIHFCNNFNFRGTEGFKIKLSKTSNGPYSTAIEYKLKDMRYKPCNDIPVSAFAPESVVKARYVEFYITSYFGLSGALQYFDIVGEKVKGNPHKHHHENCFDQENWYWHHNLPSLIAIFTHF